MIFTDVEEEDKTEPWFYDSSTLKSPTERKTSKSLSWLSLLLPWNPVIPSGRRERPQDRKYCKDMRRGAVQPLQGCCLTSGWRNTDSENQEASKC